MEFLCDKKYQNIINNLSKRGWFEVSNYNNNNNIPFNCKLIWNNLTKIKFQSIFDRYVNHYRGSSHLSNKGYFAYHVNKTNNLCYPLSWSPSYQHILILIAEVALCDLCNLTINIKILNKSLELNFYKNIDRILSNNEIWNQSPIVSSFRQLLSLLTTLLSTSSSSSINQEDQLNEIERFVMSLMKGHYQGMMRKYNSNGIFNEVNVFDELYGSLWLVKPTALSCGRDIAVVKGIHELLLQVTRMNFNCVVQKYIERPFLVRNQRKFDIRQWVLISNLNPMIIYGLSEFYLRLSGRSFTLDDNDKFIHLCNHSIQKDDDNITNNNDNNSNNNSDNNNEDNILCDTMMTQDEFKKIIGEEVYLHQIFPQIQLTSIEAILCCRDRLEKIGKGFEWLGLDLMITEDLQVALLEVNVSPDTTCSTPVTSRLVEPVTNDLFDLILDDHIVDNNQLALQAISQSYQLNLRFSQGEKLTNKELKQAARWIPNYVYGKGAEEIIKSTLSTNTMITTTNNDTNVDNEININADINAERINVTRENISNISKIINEPIWNIWYVGEFESLNEIKEFSLNKTNTLGRLKEKISLINSEELIEEYRSLVNIILSNKDNDNDNNNSDSNEISLNTKNDVNDSKDVDEDEI